MSGTARAVQRTGKLLMSVIDLTHPITPGIEKPGRVRHIAASLLIQEGDGAPARLIAIVRTRRKTR